MKRKLSTLFALVLALLTAVPMMADEMRLTEVGNVVTAPEAGKYYVIQGNGQDNQVSWLYDNNGALAAEEADEVPTGAEGMPFVWMFEESEEGFAARNLISGRYIFIEGTANGGTVRMREEPFFFTILVDNDNVAFENASGQCIDMSYSGVKPVTWSGGVRGSRVLNIFEVTVDGADDLTIARGRLEACFSLYEQYLPDYGDNPFERGTEIGQYNCTDEDYNLFVENLQLAWEILTDEVTDVTIEQIYEIIENIERGYNAIVSSIVQLTIADGNYRIVSAMEWNKNTTVNTGEVDANGNPITQTVTVHPLKGMYATLEGKAYWADIDSTDCCYLWKLTNNAETGLIKMMNIATDGILATCTQSAQATLTTNSQTEMNFEFIERRADGKIVVVMKPSTSGGYGYLHCGGHSGGNGNAGNIVGWTYIDSPASLWTLEPVSDEEVAELVEAFAPIKDHELLVSMYQDLIAETEAAIALAQNDEFITVREALISSTSQFSSPFTDPHEGSFDNVLNDDANTFWHSTWHEGEKQNHDHFFNVALNELVSGTIQCFMRRRNVTHDHITELGVYGTNDENILDSESEEGWTYLDSFDLSKNASASLTVYSNHITLDEGYKYLRFYIDGTTTGRGYGHFATFQLYKLTIDGNTQWSQMGDNATAIETALATAKEVDMEEVEMSDYDALKAALDAFKAVLADPSALAAAIERCREMSQLIAYGTSPGFWSARPSDTQSLSFLLYAASEYLKRGAYTQEELDRQTEKLTNAIDRLMAAANPVEEGKWYALKFDSEEHYDAHNWNKEGAVNTTLGDLFDNYAAPANVREDIVCFSSLEDVAVGQAVRFISDQQIEEMDQIAFRFVAQGDSAFAIQHKSGLYLNGAARSTNLTLGLTPALFNVRAVGYGKVVIEARDLTGHGYYSEPVYLHAQNAGHSLVTWNNDDVSSSSALYIEPIDESEFDEGADVQESATMRVQPNSMTFMCYPTAFSVEGAKIYAYQGAFPDDTTEGELLAHYAFNELEQSEPGQPVLLVYGDPSLPKLPVIEDYGTSRPVFYENIYITPLGTNFAVTPLPSDGVHGTYTYEWVDEGTVVVGEKEIGQIGMTIETLVLAEGEEGTDCTRDISANTGYIVYGENILTNASVDDFDYVITASRPNITFLRGDVNLDGIVDIADAVTVLNAMAGEEVPGDADVNGDDWIDVADFVTVLNIMAGE